MRYLDFLLSHTNVRTRTDDIPRTTYSAHVRMQGALVEDRKYVFSRTSLLLKGKDTLIRVHNRHARAKRAAELASGTILWFSGHFEKRN